MGRGLKDEIVIIVISEEVVACFSFCNFSTILILPYALVIHMGEFP